MNRVHECVGREHATSILEREEACMAKLDGERPVGTDKRLAVPGAEEVLQRRCGS